jgi:hypothetical protein
VKRGFGGDVNGSQATNGRQQLKIELSEEVIAQYALVRE